MLQRRTPLRAKTRLRAKKRLKGKSVKQTMEDIQYREACALADIRDKYQCKHPGCRRKRTSHHHIRFRKSEGGEDVIENLVCVCAEHHTGNDSPHSTKADGSGVKWRNYWREWQRRRYPVYAAYFETKNRITVRI